MKKIIRINASAIKESSCFRRLWLTAIEGYTDKLLNNDIHYGSCVHKCVETYALTGGDTYAASTAAQDLWREKESELRIKSTRKFLNLTHLTLTCHKFFVEVKTSPIFTDIKHLRNRNNKPMVEQKFSIPLYEGERLLILLQGTIDAIVEIIRGCICVDDWKTTCSYDADDYFLGYKLSPQLKTYLFALQWYRDNYPESFLGNLLKGKGQLGCMIHGAFLTAGGVEFKRSDVFFYSPATMSKYRSQLSELVERIRYHYETFGEELIPEGDGQFNGSCVSNTGYKCKFFGTCAAEALASGDNGPGMMKHVLNTNFRKREYRPFDFGGGHNKQQENKNEENIIASSSVGDGLVV